MKVLSYILKSSGLRLLIVLVATLFCIQPSLALPQNYTLDHTLSIHQSSEDESNMELMTTEEEEENEEQSKSLAINTIGSSNFEVVYSDVSASNISCFQQLGESNHLFIEFGCLKIP